MMHTSTESLLTPTMNETDPDQLLLLCDKLLEIRELLAWKCWTAVTTLPLPLGNIAYYNVTYWSTEQTNFLSACYMWSTPVHSQNSPTFTHCNYTYTKYKRVYVLKHTSSLFNFWVITGPAVTIVPAV